MNRSQTETAKHEDGEFPELAISAFTEHRQTVVAESDRDLCIFSDGGDVEEPLQE